MEDCGGEVVDSGGPNGSHGEIAVAALEAGKMVLCEKPLGRNLSEAQTMVDAAKTAGKRTMGWYNYRRIPAGTLAKQNIVFGKLGRIFYFWSKFLQDWTNLPPRPLGGGGWPLGCDGGAR